MEIKKSGPAKELKILHAAAKLAIVTAVILLISGIIMTIFTMAGGDFSQMGNDSLIGNIVIMASSGGTLALLSVILIIIGRMMEASALVKLSKLHKEYKTALIVLVIGLVIAAIFIVVPTPGVMMLVVIPIANLISIAAAYPIVGATAVFLRKQGAEELAANGLRMRTLFMGLHVASVAIGLLAFVPALAMGTGMITLGTAAIRLLATFKYFDFLGRAATALAD